MPLDQLLLFVAAGLLLNPTPGPDVLNIVSHAGMVAASAGAFTVLKWLGAAYLVFVGCRVLLSKAGFAIYLEAKSLDFTGASGQNGDKTIFLRDFWTNALAAPWLDRVAGVLFIGFGIKLALTRSPNA